MNLATVWIECEDREQEYEELSCAMPPFRCLNCEVAAEDRYLEELDELNDTDGNGKDGGSHGT